MFHLNPYAQQIIHTLLEYGIDYACLAPGSRSTPFAQVLAREHRFRDFIHFDERSLGFHALGYARGAQKCAPLFTTSGSALANLFPAVVEAYQDQVPMLIFSADRPVEERDCSSNQTLDQVKFFHKYALWQQDLPLDDLSLSPLYIPSLIRKALMHSRKGPVHLNCQFREPFFEIQSYKKPLTRTFPAFTSKNLSSQVKKCLSSPPQLLPDKKGLILCGRKTTQEEFLIIHKLAQKLNWPLFPDVLSFGRWGPFSQVINHFELLLDAYSAFSADLILHFGGPMQSKTLLNWLKKHPPQLYHQIHEEDALIDPNRLPFQHHPLSARDFCLQLLETDIKSSSHTIEPLQKAHNQIEQLLEKELHDFTEQSLTSHLIKAYREPRSFFVGASLPIRHLSFFCSSIVEHQVYANRGASGIDGNLSTAFGLSAALNKPLTVLVGDLTFLYDLNALAQLRFLKHPLDIVVLNNSGGNIFSYLPIREDQIAHKRYFETPHDYTLSKLAEPFGVQTFAPRSCKELHRILQTPTKEMRLIELRVEPKSSYQKYKQLTRKCKTLFSPNSMEQKALQL